MAQERQVNVMSIELALKRELAYREKLARLYPDDYSIKRFKPVQVPSAAKTPRSNPGCSQSLGQSSLSTEVHQIPITNPPCQKPPSATILSPNLSSTVVLVPRVPGPVPCPVSDLTKAALQSTVTASSFQHPEPFQTRNHTNLFCKVCKVSCSSPFNYKEHLRGQKHKNKLKIQLQGGNSTKSLQQPRCNLCQIWCTDENNLKLHFDGHKHKTKLKEIELRHKGIVLNQNLWCDLCQVPCSNEDSLRMHLKGKNHIARLYNANGEKSSAS